MDHQTLAALTLFAFAATFSPGPNNIMLLTSGANIGFQRTVPHMLGIVFGFFAMTLIVGTGLVSLLEQYPVANQVLQVACLVYLAWLAFRIATAKPELAQQAGYRPMTFLSAAWFQWINPKAWSMSLTALGAYNLSGDWQGVLLIGSVFALVTLPSVGIWTLAGGQLSRFLHRPERMRGFNISMAALLAGSALMML